MCFFIEDSFVLNSGDCSQKPAVNPTEILQGIPTIVAPGVMVSKG